MTHPEIQKVRVKVLVRCVFYLNLYQPVNVNVKSVSKKLLLRVLCVSPFYLYFELTKAFVY